MTEAEHAVQQAAAGIPAAVSARLETADRLSAEDRNAIVAIARQALVPFEHAAKPADASHSIASVAGKP